MSDVLKALESERELEKEFVAEALRSETQPKGWPAALVMFHISMWRERLRDALIEVRHPPPYTAPPQENDQGNHAELPSRLGTPPADAAAPARQLLTDPVRLASEPRGRPL